MIIFRYFQSSFEAKDDVQDDVQDDDDDDVQDDVTEMLKHFHSISTVLQVLPKWW